MKTAILALVLLVIHIASLSATIYYVDGTNGNDSWDGLAIAWDGLHGPKKTIQAGVSSASTGNYVKVAPGTYTGSLNRNISFGGKVIDIQSWGAPELTIVDCQGLSRFCSIAATESGTKITGFTIRNGYRPTLGGAIYIQNASATISYCNFINNYAGEEGGSIFSWGAIPVFEHCKFTNNYAEYSGGAISSSFNSNISLADCTISENESGDDAGGIACGDSQMTLMNCRITKNTANDLGGGILCAIGSQTISSCIISDNIAYWAGGGIYLNNTDPEIVNCVLANNLAGFFGGGIDCYGGSEPTIKNCDIVGNFAFNYGGGIDCEHTSPVLWNCILWDNRPDHIYNDTGNPTLSFCDIQGGWWGSGIQNLNEDPKFIYKEGQDYRLRPGSPCIDIANSTGAPVYDLLGRPRHDDPATPNLGWGSLPYVDVGVYEFKAYFVSSETGSDSFNGLYPAHIGGNNGPKRTVQKGIDAAIDGDTVEVAAGTYSGNDSNNRNIDPKGKAIHIIGMGGAEATIIDANLLSNVFMIDSGEEVDTVIDGFEIRKGFGSYGGGMYCYNTSPTIMDCRFVENLSSSLGGGICLHSSCSPQIIKCIFDRNISEWIGGGIACLTGASPTVSECIFKDNIAESRGAAICSWGGNPTIEKCQIYGNKVLKVDEAYGGGGLAFFGGGNGTIRDSQIAYNNAKNATGGGIYCNGSNISLSDCMVIGNEAGIYAGGIFWSASYSTAANCLIAGNRCTSNGGGAAIYASPVIMTNCTIANNSNRGGFSGGGIAYSRWFATQDAVLTNCIIWGNNSGQISYITQSPVLNYCDIQGGWSGSGSSNISSDPQLVRLGYWDNNGRYVLGNFHTLWTSPCIDTGTNSAPILPATDLDDYARIQFGKTALIADIGAYEFGSYIPIWNVKGRDYMVQITWCSSGLAGRKYDVLCCYEDINNQKQWNILAYDVPTQGELTTYEDYWIPASQYRFYQIRESGTTLTEQPLSAEPLFK